MSLEITQHLHQAAYLAGQAQTVYALLEFKPAGVAGRLPLDLRLVLDVSGSMGAPARQGGRQTKLELLRQAVSAMIDQLALGDRLCLVAFDDQAELVYDDVLTTEADRKYAQSLVAKLRVGGGTDMPLGLEAALDEPPMPDRVCRLVAVTDGETIGQDRCERLAFEARGSCIWLVYGVGIEYDDRFLDTLARANGGQFVHLSDLKAASAAFTHEVQVMGEVAIQNLVVSLEPAPGVTIARADRVVPQLLPLAVDSPQFLSVDLGDVDRSRGQKLLLQLAVPASSAGVQPLARVRCGFHVPVRKLLNQTLETMLEARFTTDVGAIAADADVLRTVQLAGANRLTTLGMAEAASGQAAQGAFTLASAAAVYDALGRSDLSTRLKTISSAMATQSGLDGEQEDVRRTLSTMARQPWDDDHA